MQDIFKKIMNTAILMVLVVITVATIYLAYLWGIDNRNIPSNIQFLTSSVEVKMGDEFFIDTKITRNRSCKVIIERTFTNLDTKEVFFTVPAESQLAIVSDQITHVAVVLPATIVPGPYLFRYTFNYYCNASNALFGPIVYSPDSLFVQIVP